MRLPLAVFAATVATVATAACGARTELPVEPGAGGAPHDAGPDAPVHVDAGADGPVDAALDAPPDAPPDVVDAPPDAPPDVIPIEDCQDAGVTYIYLIGNDDALLRFDPSTLTTTTIGTITCPLANPSTMATPYSMAVDRAGIAYVVYTDGELFRVSTATASCKATSFVVGQGGFSTEFGMGFSSDTSDPNETLFVAGNQSMQLATLDTTAFAVSPIGAFSSPIGEAELTGTGTGELYAFGLVVASGMTQALHLARIEKATAAVIDDAFVTVQSGTAQIFDWAFAYWGGAFYFFTSTDGTTTIVSRYQPGGPLALPVVATIDSAIVGAGVSTCAPAQ